MKRYLLLAVITFAVLTGYSQECENYIELLGKGITGIEDEASISIPDHDQVDFVIAEAIYKSQTEPTDVRFWTDLDEEISSPELITLSGGPTSGYITSVFRAQFEGPVEEVNLDFLDNGPAFHSFALYVHRLDGGVYSILSGELFNVYHNEDSPQVIDIAVPVSPDARDIGIRFGVTELNDDERWAVFTFEADGMVVKEELKTWSQGDGTDSYIILEVLFEDVAGDVDNITMTLLSENKGGERDGDSFVAGVVLVDLPCEEYETDLLCSYTQGYYGNEGGKTCQGLTTRELLEALLDTDLVLGGDGNTFTIAAGDVDCVIDLLPGGGPSKVLEGEGSCDDPESYDANKQGRLKNTLLAQAITLELNVRLSPDLLEFPVDGTMFVTRVAEDCFDPNTGGIAGTEMSYGFSQEVADQLGADATIADLLELVNSALAGEDISPLSLSQVSDAATMVNEAFDECVVVYESSAEGSSLEEEKSDEGTTKGVTNISENGLSNQLIIYPNPVKDHFYMSITSRVVDVKSAGIYSVTGVLVKTVKNRIEPGKDQVLEIDAGDLLKGIYFVRIDTGAGSISRRFAVQ
ncbi:MAG: T9SS type A sorting domain-containing protein [Bacteroidota bacterium]